MRKKIIGLLVLILLVVGVVNWELISYGWMQTKGQAKVLLGAKPVEEVLADAAFPDSLKMKIRLIEEIKRYGEDSLGLNPSKNYTTFFDQHGKPLMWVVTASKPFKMEAYEWDFPILGKFPYKGFFDSTRAKQEQNELIKLSFDTNIGSPSAWSTLGYFKDPIMSEMLQKNEGQLASLILHELTHGTLFVKDNVELNENLASFVGDYGALNFLRSKYGTNSKEIRQYDFEKRFDAAWSAHMVRGARELDSLYKAFEKVDDSKKRELKAALIAKIFTDTDTLLRAERTFSPKWSPRKNTPNNAYFINFLTYSARQDVFLEEFEGRFQGNFADYLSYLKQKYPSL